MIESVLYIVLLAKTAPQEILRALGSHIHEIEGSPCLVSTLFEWDRSCWKLEILPKDENKPRTVWLAIQYVPMVEALAAEDVRQKIGFHS